MASQGPSYPATTANLIEASTAENKDAWVSPANVGADDGTESTITAATFDSPDISQILVASNFGFSIPTGSTIDGIIVEIDRRNSADAASDNRVQLATGTTFATLVGTNKADVALDWPTATAVATYGGASDTWSAGLTVAQINAVGFAVFLSVQADAANTDIQVDYIRVTVHYTAPPVVTRNDLEAKAVALGATFGFAVTAADVVYDIIAGKAPTTNGTPTFRQGPVARAIVFANIANFISFADHADFDRTDGPFTWWWAVARDLDNNSQQGLVRKGTNAYAINVNGSAGTNPDGIGLGKQGVAFLCTGNTDTPVDGTWHTGAVARSAAGAGNTLIYYDATEGHTDSASIGTALADTTTALEIGKDDSTFDGAVEYLFLFPSQLSAASINELQAAYEISRRSGARVRAALQAVNRSATY